MFLCLYPFLILFFDHSRLFFYPPFESIHSHPLTSTHPYMNPPTCSSMHPSICPSIHPLPQTCNYLSLSCDCVDNKKKIICLFLSMLASILLLNVSTLSLFLTLFSQSLPLVYPFVNSSNMPISLSLTHNSHTLSFLDYIRERS